MWAKKSVKRSLALIFILIIGAFLAWALWPYRNAFFFAFILYVLFHPFYQFLHESWHWRRGAAAGLIILITLVIVLLPLSVIISVLVQESQQAVSLIQDKIGVLSQLTNNWPDAWRSQVNDELAKLVQYTGSFFVGTVKAVGSQVLIYMVMYFMLFYLLVTDEDKLKSLVASIIPFSRDNAARLQQEFRNITHSTIVASGMIAIIQAGLLTIFLVILGVPGALLLGFLGLIFAFLPVIGIPIIWIPVAIMFMIDANWGYALTILIAGTFLSTFDNFLRPMIQRRVGQMHPFVSILGVVIGVSVFGLVGVVVGPLLLSFFILMVRMFNEENIK